MCLGASCLFAFPLSEERGFSQPPLPCSLAALESAACTKLDGSSAWLLIQAIVHSTQQETSNQMLKHIRPGDMTGTPAKIRPKQQPRILESPKWSVGEQTFPDRFSKKYEFSQNRQSTSKTESPLRPFGKSIGRF